jgi:hypothetical protein
MAAEPDVTPTSSSSNTAATSPAAIHSLQQQLRESEERISTVISRHRTLQADYHRLISVASELVHTLTLVLNGEQVTPDYLAHIVPRLAAFRKNAAGGGMPSQSPAMHGGMVSSGFAVAPRTAAAAAASLPPPMPLQQASKSLPNTLVGGMLTASVADGDATADVPTTPVFHPRFVQNLEQFLDYDILKQALITPDKSPYDVRKKCIILHALRWVSRSLSHQYNVTN